MDMPVVLVLFRSEDKGICSLRKVSEKSYVQKDKERISTWKLVFFSFVKYKEYTKKNRSKRN